MEFCGQLFLELFDLFFNRRQMVTSELQLYHRVLNLCICILQRAIHVQLLQLNVHMLTYI